MCGIAGAIGRIDESLQSAVSRMCDAQQHRGPNASGCMTQQFLNKNESGIVLGHRRLSIIDLTDEANQPMVDPQTKNILVFNGEIYNYRELRIELEKAGSTFHTKSDTEVVLHAYRVWGRDCVQRFRGMFALAIWDESQQHLVLMRDRLGIKPLYYAHVQHQGSSCFLFASELRALLASNLIHRRLNPAGLKTFLWHGFVVGSQTIVDGVQLLPAASLATITSDCAMRVQQYWSLEQNKTPVTNTDALHAELQEAVKLRLISDVPLGIFLSGGVDSSAVAALAVQAGGSTVRTFNISFEETAFDESSHARAVAEQLGTEHHEIPLTQQLFQNDLDKALHSIDQPTFDAINTFFVSRAVREAGITVALAGTGGDELFGGYKSFLDLPKAKHYSSMLRPLPKSIIRTFAKAITRYKTGAPGEVPPQTRWGKLADVLTTRGDLLALYQLAYGLFTPDFLSQLNHASSAQTQYGLPPQYAKNIRDQIKNTSTLNAISTLELQSFIGQRLLRDTDCASMAVSLEVRVPLLDHRIVEEVSKLENNLRYQPLGKKMLLRNLAMPSLDASMFDRPKAGFVLPIEQWARAALQKQVEQTLLDRELCASVGLDADAVARLWRSFQADAPGLYWSRIWAIFVLLWWCRTHKLSL